MRVQFIVQRLVNHQYGNYVIQRALAIVSDPELRQQMLEAVKPLASSLQGTKHGLKVLSRLQKLYPQAFGGGHGDRGKAKHNNVNGIAVNSGASSGTKKNRKGQKARQHHARMQGKGNNMSQAQQQATATPAQQ